MKDSKRYDEERIDIVRSYLDEINRYPLLSAEEERDLARRIDNGDSLAKNKMIESNLRLVVNIAKQYSNCGLELMDLVQEGNLGLMKATKKYDYTTGNRFSTYATWWIRQAITRSIGNDSRTIRLPVHVIESLNALKKTVRHYVQNNGFEPTDSEIAVEMGIDAEKVKQLKSYLQQPISIYQPIGEEKESCLMDFIPDDHVVLPEDAAEKNVLRQQIINAMECLSDRECMIIKLRFGFDDDEPQTLEQIGSIMGITRERVRQIEKKGLDKIRRKGYLLEDFLDRRS